MAEISSQDILDFWFSDAVAAYWFVRSDDLDRHITEKFGALYQQAIAGELEGWKQQAFSALALTILLDQFPRNMFRGSPRAFGSDAKACALSKFALEQGYDQDVSAKARPFFYLPLMHSENLADQERCVGLYEVLGDEFSLGFAREHRDIIETFGRFPHRNAVLGRRNTPQETEFLKTHSGF